MIPITEIPEFIHAFAGIPALKMNSAQRRHLEEYLTGLIVCDNHTVAAMNDLFTGHRDQSAKNNFMTDSPWDDKKLEAVRNELIRQAIKKNRISKGALIFDDTLLHKTGKDIAYTGTFYDHCSNSYVHAQQMVTSHFVCRDFHVPLDFEIYQKAEQMDKKDFMTKIELFKVLFKNAKQRQVPIEIALMDSWFLCKETADFLEEKNHFPYIAAAKSSLLMYTRTADMSLSEYAASLPAKAFKKIELVLSQGHKRSFWYFTKCVKLKTIGKVRLVITYEADKIRGKSEPKFMVTNQAAWEIRRILREYSQRWCIERFYQESKQHLGLESCELRKPLGIQRHFRMVFLADTLLQLNAMVGTLTRWFKTNVKSLSGKCNIVKSQVVRSFISWTLRQSQLHREVDDILEMAFLPQKQLRFTLVE